MEEDMDMDTQQDLQTAPQPETEYAMQALQAEIRRLRAALGEADDTRIYFNAMLMQVQSEANAEIQRLVSELSQAKGEPAA